MAKKLPAAQAPDRLSDNCHCDQLSDMKDRIYSLHLAICGIADDINDSSAGPALSLLSLDIADQMRAIYEAFSLEHDLRLAEKRP